MKLAEFYARLERHDWWYEMSDDPKVFRAGQAERDALRVIAITGPEHQDLYEAMVAHHRWNGTGARPPKPARPVEVGA